MRPSAALGGPRRRCGGAAARAIFLGATTSIDREGVWLATVSLAVLATLVAVFTSEPDRRSGWSMIAGCLGLFVVANLPGNPRWATEARGA